MIFFVFDILKNNETYHDSNCQWPTSPVFLCSRQTYKLSNTTKKHCKCETINHTINLQCFRSSVLFKKSLIFKLTSNVDEPEVIVLGFNAKVNSFDVYGYLYLYLAFHNNSDDTTWFPSMEVPIYVDTKVKIIMVVYVTIQ